MSTNINKTGLINSVVADTSLTRAQATDAVHAVFDAILRAVAGGNTVAIAGFGAFRPADRAARTARNPHTGEPIAVPPATLMKFKPAKGAAGAVAAGDITATIRAGVTRQ